MALRTSSGPPLGKIAIGVGVVLALAVFGASYLFHRARNIEEAKAWTLSGPPCPTVSDQAFAAERLAAPQAVRFDGVVFARAYGAMSCASVHSHGGEGLTSFPTCQFTSPFALVITTSKRVFRFRPGFGHSAVVQVRGGKAECALQPVSAQAFQD